MTDEPQGDSPEPETGTTVAETAAPPEAGAPEAGAPEPDSPEAGKEADGEEKKLRQTVDIQDTGPCKKHIKVSVERADIDERLDEEYAKLVDDSQVPGFRPGKAPRKVVIRRFEKEVTDQVKSQVLLASLEQLAEDHDIAPLSPPDINPAKLEIPKEGPFIYEFNVEVRPQFDLPNYKGLKLRRPVKEFADEEVEKEEHRLLARYGQKVPKPEGNAQVGDFVTVDMTTRFKGQVIGSAKETTLRVDDALAFKDGVAEKFGEQIRGASAGDTRVVDITLTDAVANDQLRGQQVQATLDIMDVKKLRLPELTHEFLHEFGVHSPEQLREMVRVLLERRLEYTQRQSAREQVLEQIAGAAQWELPQDLLMRQAKKTLARRVMEMREAGMSEDEIKGRQRLLQRDVLQSTALALKEHFVLQKIAEVEKIDINQDDIDAEIERLADQSNESPRRVRAQLEKEDLLDTLAAQLIERKSLDLILGNAEYEDVPLDKEQAVATVETQAVPGEMKDPTAPPPEVKADEETSEKQ